MNAQTRIIQTPMVPKTLEVLVAPGGRMPTITLREITGNN